MICVRYLKTVIQLQARLWNLDEVIISNSFPLLLLEKVKKFLLLYCKRFGTHTDMLYRLGYCCKVIWSRLVRLKGVWHKIFEFRSFSWKRFPRGHWVYYLYENSRRYSQLCVTSAMKKLRQYQLAYISKETYSKNHYMSVNCKPATSQLIWTNFLSQQFFFLFIASRWHPWLTFTFASLREFS